MNQKPLHSRDEVRDFLKRPDLSDHEVEELQEKVYALVGLMVDDYLDNLHNHAKMDDK